MSSYRINRLDRGRIVNTRIYATFNVHSKPIHLFMAYPFWPKKIVSDRGSEFVNKALKLLTMYEQLGVKRILTAHDNAQTNQVKRFHKYMNAAIACFLQKKHRQILWEQYLDNVIVVYVYRCTVNNSTGYSPFFARTVWKTPRQTIELHPQYRRRKFCQSERIQ